MTIITPELRLAIEQAGRESVLVLDPDTNTTYLLVKQDDYLVLPIDWSGNLSPEERCALLRDFGDSKDWENSSDYL